MRKAVLCLALLGILYLNLYAETNESDKFNRFNNNFIGGWPSGHTANAFPAAATISKIYKDNIWFWKEMRIMIIKFHYILLKIQ